MMLYKSTDVMVCLSDGDTEINDMYAGILQGDQLAAYLLIIWQDNVSRYKYKKQTIFFQKE